MYRTRCTDNERKKKEEEKEIVLFPFSACAFGMKKPTEILSQDTGLASV
jgi:hypothetical protein